MGDSDSSSQGAADNITASLSSIRQALAYDSDIEPYPLLVSTPASLAFHIKFHFLTKQVKMPQ